jgi:hypothetical protein
MAVGADKGYDSPRFVQENAQLRLNGLILHCAADKAESVLNLRLSAVQEQSPIRYETKLTATTSENHRRPSLDRNGTGMR